jgi:restriction system protein
LPRKRALLVAFKSSSPAEENAATKGRWGGLMAVKQDAWMVRAGEHGWRIEEFEKQSIVSIGWAEMGNLSSLNTWDEFRQAVARAYPADNKFKVGNAAGQLFRFARDIKVGDAIVTYHPSERHYLVGTVTGAYEYRPEASVEQPNQHAVQWRGRVPRDQLSVAARNTLGAISTLFSLPAEVMSEMEHLLSGEALPTPPVVEAIVPQLTPAAEQVADIYKDIQNRAFEFIKDRVDQLQWDEMQELVAGLLRAMGYKTRVSPSGSDRGKDIVASPDGLGLEDPRIVVEVKHRGAAMGAPEIRGFLGGRHDKDKGLYVSTGGFTKEARYEAERARIPVTLLDLDDLVNLVLEHYESLDMPTQRLVALRKLYWPA